MPEGSRVKDVSHNFYVITTLVIKEKILPAQQRVRNYAPSETKVHSSPVHFTPTSAPKFQRKSSCKLIAKESGIFPHF